jgi:hypothetical protein
MRRREAVIDLYKAILGAFLFTSPWLFAFPFYAMRFDAWIDGAILSLLSITTLFIFAEWEEWVNLFIGFWLLISPWILSFQHTSAMHVCVGVGTIVVYLSIVELWLIHFLPDSARVVRRQ